mmetsp:Transcript_88207/g.284895  ORF Transcript_88207/g.284895 Transcript_88207/m.284895 type:complete len:243 (-) Transcript_88207:1236-1964(-)
MFWFSSKSPRPRLFAATASPAAALGVAASDPVEDHSGGSAAVAAAADAAEDEPWPGLPEAPGEDTFRLEDRPGNAGGCRWWACCWAPPTGPGFRLLSDAAAAPPPPPPPRPPLPPAPAAAVDEGGCRPSGVGDDAEAGSASTAAADAAGCCSSGIAAAATSRPWRRFLSRIRAFEVIMMMRSSSAIMEASRRSRCSSTSRWPSSLITTLMCRMSWPPFPVCAGFGGVLARPCQSESPFPMRA